MNKCFADETTIQKFQTLTRGNWKNSVYVECKQCKYEPHEACGDFLYIPDETGTPVILSVSDCMLLFAKNHRSKRMLVVDRSPEISRDLLCMDYKESNGSLSVPVYQIVF